MQITQLVKALEKAEMKMVKKPIGKDKETLWKYTCTSSTHKCEFYHSGDTDDCRTVEVMRKNESKNFASEYFPPSYCSTVKAVVSHMRGDW